MFDLARPAFLPPRVLDLRPPDDLGLLGDGDGAFVRRLLVAVAVALARDVLLIDDAVDPDLPVAAADVAQEIDRPARRHEEVIRADPDVAARARAPRLRRRHHAGKR